jgi:hypothetical protein
MCVKIIMMKLKSNPLNYRIKWVKKDIKRLIILLTIPIIVLLLFPSFGFSLFGITVMSINQQIQWSIYAGIFAFTFCFIVQLVSNQKPDYNKT